MIDHRRLEFEPIVWRCRSNGKILLTLHRKAIIKIEFYETKKMRRVLIRCYPYIDQNQKNVYNIIKKIHKQSQTHTAQDIYKLNGLANVYIQLECCTLFRRFTSRFWSPIHFFRFCFFEYTASVVCDINRVLCAFIYLLLLFLLVFGFQHKKKTRIAT